MVRNQMPHRDAGVEGVGQTRGGWVEGFICTSTRGILKTTAMVVRRKPAFVPLKVQPVPTQMAPRPTRKPAPAVIRPARLKQGSFVMVWIVCAATNNKKDIRGDARTFPALLSHSVKKYFHLKKSCVPPHTRNLSNSNGWAPEKHARKTKIALL